MNSVSLLIIPCVVALALKILLAWRTRHQISRANIVLWLFIFSMFSLNLGDFFSFLFAKNDQSPQALITLKFIYISGVAMSLLYWSVAMDIGGYLSKPFIMIISFLQIIGSIAILIPGVVLEGVTNVGYSLTRVKGDYYFLFVIIFIGGIVLGYATLGYIKITNKELLATRRATALLIGTLPIVIVSVVIVFLMQLGFKLNLSLFGEFASLFLLYVLIISEQKEQLYSFLAKVPSTKEYALNKKISAAIATHDLSGLKNLIEEAMIPEALQISEGNVSQAAKLLGVSRNTINRRLKEFEDAQPPKSDD